MGSSNSKAEKVEALRLCRERKRFIKQSIDSRYALAAAHVSYIQSLRNIGIALRRYAEAEVLIGSTQSISNKTPSHSSIPSPSPSHVGEISDSPLHNESPLSPPVATLSYVRSGGSNAVTVRVNPSSDSYLDEEIIEMPMPPPPPPPESGLSWDFFHPSADTESFRFVVHNALDEKFDDKYKGEEIDSNRKTGRGKWTELGLGGDYDLYDDSLSTNLKLEQKCAGESVLSQDNLKAPAGVEGFQGKLDKEERVIQSGNNATDSTEIVTRKEALEQSSSKRENLQQKKF